MDGSFWSQKALIQILDLWTQAFISNIVIRCYWFGYSFLLDPGFLLILSLQFQLHLVIFWVGVSPAPYGCIDHPNV